MDILLINPSQHELYGGLHAPDHPPMGLAYIGAALEKNGHKVKIVDIDADGVSKEQFVRIIKEGRFLLAGITTLTPSFNKALSVAQVIKENSHSTYTVLGGVHPTVMPEESIRSNFIDFLIMGEGDVTISELARALEEKSDFSRINGLAYKKNGQIHINKLGELIEDLDALPFPARHLFNNYSYTYPDALLYPVMPIITSRGCPGACTYCSAANVFRRKFRMMSAVKVVDELELLVRQYKVKEIHVWDDNFITHRERVFRIRDEVKKRNLKLKFAFPNGLRIDYLNEEVIKALCEIGTYSIAVGVESGNQKVLDSVNKNITLRQIREKFKLIKDYKLESWAFFVIGFPGETNETIADTIRFAIELDPDIAKFHILKPFPGTRAHDDLASQGLITDTCYDHYGIHTKPVHRLHSVSEEELLAWQQKAYRMFYFRPKKIASQLLRLRSWHRFKLNSQMGVSFLKKLLKK